MRAIFLRAMMSPDVLYELYNSYICGRGGYLLHLDPARNVLAASLRAMTTIQAFFQTAQRLGPRLCWKYGARDYSWSEAAQVLRRVGAGRDAAGGGAGGAGVQLSAHPPGGGAGGPGGACGGGRGCRRRSPPDARR